MFYSIVSSPPRFFTIECFQRSPYGNFQDSTENKWPDSSMVPLSFKRRLIALQ